MSRALDFVGRVPIRVRNGKEPMVEIPVSRFKLVEAKA